MKKKNFWYYVIVVLKYAVAVAAGALGYNSDIMSGVI